MFLITGGKDLKYIIKFVIFVVVVLVELLTLFNFVVINLNKPE